MPKKKKPYRSEHDPRTAKITHIMADGTVRDSVEGYFTSIDQIPPLVLDLICKIAFSSEPAQHHDES